MSAVLSDLGIRESRNDMFTMSVIVGTNSVMHSFRSQVGNGSSSHDFAGDSLMIFRISTSVASIKVVSGVPEKEVVIEPHLHKPGNPNGQYFVVKEGALLPIIFLVNRNKAFGLSLLSSTLLAKYEVLASTSCSFHLLYISLTICRSTSSIVLAATLSLRTLFS